MVDPNGFPGTRGEDGTFDGGDTAAIIGNLLALIQYGVSNGFHWSKLVGLQRKLMIYGLPVRHPDQSKWWGQTDRFSRDQLIATLCSQIPTKTSLADELFRAHQKNWFCFSWNTRRNGIMDAPAKSPDLTLFEVWALWIRIYRPLWARLVLWILDLETLAGAIHWRWFRKDNVCRNHMLICISGMRSLPTWTMRLAFWVNDWRELIFRWERHCHLVGEYQTAGLFRDALRRLT